MSEIQCKRNRNGFRPVEGIVVFAGALLALGSATWALWGHWIAFAAFLLGTLTFSVLYAMRLCKHCEKNCPFHPSVRFWKSLRGH